MKERNEAAAAGAEFNQLTSFLYIHFVNFFHSLPPHGFSHFISNFIHFPFPVNEMDEMEKSDCGIKFIRHHCFAISFLNHLTK